MKSIYGNGQNCVFGFGWSVRLWAIISSLTLILFGIAMNAAVQGDLGTIIAIADFTEILNIFNIIVFIAMLLLLLLSAGITQDQNIIIACITIIIASIIDLIISFSYSLKIGSAIFLTLLSVVLFLVGFRNMQLQLKKMEDMVLKKLILD